MENPAAKAVLCTACLKHIRRPNDAFKKFIDHSFYRQGQGDPEVHDRYCSSDCFITYQSKKYDEAEERTKRLQKQRRETAGKVIKASRPSLRIEPVRNAARLKQKEKRRQQALAPISYDELVTPGSLSNEHVLAAEYARIYGNGLMHTCSFEHFKLIRKLAAEGSTNEQ